MLGLYVGPFDLGLQPKKIWLVIFWGVLLGPMLGLSSAVGPMLGCLGLCLGLCWAKLLLVDFFWRGFWAHVGSLDIFGIFLSKLGHVKL